MNATTLEPKTNTQRNRSMLPWIVRIAPQAYSFEDIHGDLAEEISAAGTHCKSDAEAIPCVEAEEFEAAYQWFYS